MSCPFGWLSAIATVIVAIQFIAKVVPWIYQNIGPLILGPKLKLRNFGDWAVVTGATDGIGKSYAKQLAQQGLNIVLISRTQSKLDKVAAEIENEYKVKTKTVAVDFSGGSEIYEKIGKEIKGISIGILVNNVAVCYEYPEFFLQVEDGDKLFDQILRCNVASVVNMTKLVLPIMLTDQRGIIVNIASISGKIPQPLLTVYSASKTFVDKFSEDINTEYRSQGIMVQSILPGYVSTNMIQMTPTDLLCPSADQYVTAALRSLGYANRTSAYLPHALLRFVLTTLYSYVPFFNRIMLTAMKREKIKRLAWIQRQKLAAKSQ